MTLASLKGTSDKDAPSLNADDFRKSMRSLAGTVTVISTEGEGELHGFTATAVCSVCAEPPTLLIAVNRTARTYNHLARKSSFVVNILAEDQSDIAQHFSSKGDDQFDGVDHYTSQNGLPIIKNTAAHFECIVDQVHDVGTHSLFIGQVIDTESSIKRPLAYCDAKYCHLKEN